MSKHVLILGAGLVSQPIIDYLFKNTDFYLTVADIIEENAAKAINNHSRGKSAGLDVHNEDTLGQLVAESDLVVSLLPYALHGIVAKHCLQADKHMVNASYVSEEMKSYDAEAREKNLLFLCEIGLDPGIDHMSAMQIIHSVQKRGGKIDEFVSVCGGLPAPEANTNPFGYKFSWSPKGVLLAGNNPAQYIDGGALKKISAQDLFYSTAPMKIDGKNFEAYPNRDSTAYEAIYGLEGIDLLMRGTLRYAGWHKLVLALKALNLLTETPIPAGASSYAGILAKVSGLNESNLRAEVASKLGVAEDGDIVKALKWLGLFDSKIVDFPATSAIDLLAEIMNDKMAYGEGERDMVALQHRFKATFSDHKEEITSTLFDYGIPNGNSSMARTVSLPLAIAVKLILEGKINLTGVQIPVDPIIYEPVLMELKSLGIEFEEEIVRS
ncbi:MAG: saccharopine dehydrogenase NADP-binding domain-containing protein [FCB group bacterium]|nr:saccharopine dehydrogenase NADP-binding domain-containing protein [FCB group bacterium]MBL7026803.1 saccharopine dehydrogenase NADP-binding domain-containing protein [Candidatus Neomarinimicrobiota bacterium]MBL7121380.1 saccharopine dehydrogenase NADP-binding domain-containing protein [Candidatus Neomarinimicrobiota bacterium]